jgi:galactonate dehydratase
VKIADIQCHVMPVTRSDGAAGGRNWLFVEIRTDDNLIGLGEATTEFHEMAVKAQIETELRPRLLGMDPTDIERIWQLGYRDFWWRRGIVHTSAMSGIDQALWDIAGKAANLPVFRLLGGKVRHEVRCYVRKNPEFSHLDREQTVSELHKRGFDAFKIGLGACLTAPFDPDRQVHIAIDEVRRYRELLGPNAALMIDMRGALDPVRAHRVLEGLRPLNMHFVEEPTNADTLEPTLRLKRAFPDMTIASGERWLTRWDCRPWFEQQAVDVCQVDMCHAGGISELMKIAHMAEVYGIRIAPHNPYGPVALAACVHVGAAVHNFDLLEHCPIEPVFNDIQAVKVPIADGRIDIQQLGTRPGLGVTLDMDRLRGAEPFAPMPQRRLEMRDGSTPMI